MELADPPAPGTGPARRWTFLTNHARALIAIARDPDLRHRDLATHLGITERAARTIVTDLETAGYLTHTRIGRRNHYTIDPRCALHGDAGRLLRLFTTHDHAAPAPHPARQPGGGISPGV